MKMMSRLPLLFVLALLAGCSTSAQLLVPPASPSLRVRPAVSSIEVRDMSLPRYAAGDEVVVLNSDGEVDALRGTVWADDPERSLTLALSENLATITGARVSTEPWPFLEPPGVSISVRVTRLLATEGGMLQFSGQYAIAPVTSGLADRSGQFAISVPIGGNSAQAIALAQSQAVANLAETLARRIGR